MSQQPVTFRDTDIAIVGVAGRFPGAVDVEQFWCNVRDGVESIVAADDAALRTRGVPDADLNDAQFIRAEAALPDADRFDAAFFGYSPREAEDMDPQHRVFLESAWHALEHAGYDAPACQVPVGVYAGVGVNTYLLLNLMPSGRFTDFRDISALQGLMNGNNKDSMSTTVAYKLNLRGPAVTVQTACSTSLAAVHVACRSLLNHECDMALAGGVWLNLLHNGGYRHQPGAILSSDGHCRAFAANADGTVIGSGVGVVVLKRAADAQADGDTLYAIIKGSALNNDGAAKIGYTAPSVEGQAEVIAAAQAMAEVPPRSVTYIEAHGTGTVMGDPIEIAALTRAFRLGTAERGFCAIGSVKSNVGHLDAAAGIAGLIKTVQALRHRTLPPTLHCHTPNPQIDFAASPFYVNTVARAWPAGTTPRRAGVSSFGIGGTNVHVVLEEAPPESTLPASRRWQVLPVSARTPGALQTALEKLSDHVQRHPEQVIDDVAHTLQVGRHAFAHRAVALVRYHNDAARVLSTRDPQRSCIGQASSDARAVTFLFPGQGSQHVNMAHALYETEPVFRAELDRCAQGLMAPLGCDLRSLIYPEHASAEAAERLSQTALTQPALFAVEYALARLWMSWGIQPRAMLGHSIGEYVAACIAGVFTLEEALLLVAVRGRLLQALPGGSMLAVPLPEGELQCFAARCDLAAVNAAQQCVLSGGREHMEDIERELSAQSVAVQRLQVSHAFHSRMVEPACAALEAHLAGLRLHAPAIPFVSNVTGTWITTREATDPRYWVRHLRGTVRFHDGLTTLLRDPGCVLIEVGPGDVLTQLARRHELAGKAAAIVSSQPGVRQSDEAGEHLALSLGRVWISGVDVQWDRLRGGEPRRRVPLPMYPFERQSYWVSADARNLKAATRSYTRDGARPLDEWFYMPSWQRLEPVRNAELENGRVLVFGNADVLTAQVMDALARQGARAVLVEAAQSYDYVEGRCRIRPGDAGDLRALLAASGAITRVLHLWSIDSRQVARADQLARGFLTLTVLADALESVQPDVDVVIHVATCGVADVTGAEALQPERALLIGPCKVIPQEYPRLSCRLMDIEPVPSAQAIDQLAREALTGDGPTIVAHRGRYRWAQQFTPLRLPAPSSSPWREQGVYLITGGLGGIGLALAEQLASTAQARLVLAGRSAPNAEQQRVLARLQAAGAEVCVVQADLAQPEAVRTLVRCACERFGRVHGVFHAAGVAGGGLVCEATAERAERVFGAKVAGTTALLDALVNEPLDFVLLFSSLAAIAGGLRKVDYSAANAFLDITAHVEARHARYPVIAVNWDSWREVGMAADMDMPDGVGIAPADGIAACERIVAAALQANAQIIVSTLDLNTRIERSRGDMLAQPFMMPSTERSGGHARPALATPFQPPEGELQDGIASIWRSLLGIEQIGRHDNFFELGGDSLLGIQILTRVRSQYAVNLQPARFFKQPTVDGLALLVEELLLDEVERGEAVSLAE